MRRLFLWTCWLPPALWLATLAYIRPYDGWGAWAAAPLLLPSLGLAAVYGLFGIGVVVGERERAGRWDWATIVGTLVAASPVLYHTAAYFTRTV